MKAATVMKVIITQKNDKILVLLMHHNQLQALHVIEPDNLLGNIYLARVQKVLPGLNSAFVDITAGCPGFLRQADPARLKNNDLIPVQVIASAGKNKPPTVSSILSLSGHYCVVSCQKSGLTFSGKLNVNQKKKIKAGLTDLEDIFTRHRVIIRTNAAVFAENDNTALKEEIDNTALKEEIRRLSAELALVLQHAGHRTCYSLLRAEPAGYFKAVQDIRECDYDEIVTDLAEVFTDLQDIYPEKIRFYQDEEFSLSKLYNVDNHIRLGLMKKVWLDSGGYLVIEPTEALTVIDVNSGKQESRKITSFLPLNRHAAEEIARQLRIRNLSGIIIIDFINMNTEAEVQELLTYMRELVNQDSVKTTVAGMTALGLVEITRKKMNKTLYETMKPGSVNANAD